MRSIPLTFTPLLVLVLAMLSITSGYATDTTQVAVQFKSGKYTLHGNLILPKSEHKVPVVVFLVGSGGNSSHRTTYKEWRQENLEQLLLPEGVGILYFDKRGVGASEGKWHKTDFYERAADAKAAIDFLKQHSSVDSTQIGVVGHSQGGWIAQLVASRYASDIAFAVSLAGPPFGVHKQLVNDYISELLCKQIDPAEARAKAEKQAKRAFRFTGLFPIKQDWKQLKLIKTFEPAADIQSIQAPFLFLFGENDALVNPEWSEKELKALFPEGMPSHISYRIVPEANHSFRRAPLCHDESWEDMPYSGEYQQLVTAWIVNRLKDH